MPSPIFQMRLDPERRARWERAAKEHGCASLAEFVNRCVEGELREPRDLADIRPKVATVGIPGGKVFKGMDPKGGRK